MLVFTPVDVVETAIGSWLLWSILAYFPNTSRVRLLVRCGQRVLGSLTLASVFSRAYVQHPALRGGFLLWIVAG